MSTITLTIILAGIGLGFILGSWLGLLTRGVL